MKVVAKTPELDKMMEELRDNHIDIIPIIEFELSQILPSFIEDVIRSVYQSKIVKVVI